MFEWIQRFTRRKAKLADDASPAAHAAHATVFDGSPGYVLGASEASIRPRTAQFRREGLAAVFEAWRDASVKERLSAACAAPMPEAYSDPAYGERCAQVFLDLAGQLWPADADIAGIRDAKRLSVPWQTADVTHLRRRINGR